MPAEFLGYYIDFLVLSVVILYLESIAIIVTHFGR